MEKDMVTHSSVLAWRIPGTGEPGGLLSMGSHRVGHDWSDLAAAAAAEFQKNIYFCFIDYAKAFDYVDLHKAWKFLMSRECHTTWPASWEICMQVRKQQLELNMQQQTGSK